MRSLTVGQRKKPSQHFVRKGRLTARNFGSAINAKKVTPSFIKRLLGKYEFSRVKAGMGVENETEFIKAFTAKKKNTMRYFRQGCGLTSQVVVDLPLSTRA